MSGHAADEGPGVVRVDGRGPISDEQFRLLARHIPTPCWMADADGYIFWYNRRWYQYTGRTPAEMEGWGWQSVHDPDVLPEVMAKWAASIATGAPFELTFPLLGADGRYRPFLTRIEPLLDADGAVVRWFGVNTDVSAQVAAEQQLRAANEALQLIAAERKAILGQLGEGVIVTGPDGRITFVNDAAKRLHGVAALDVEPDAYATTYSLFTEDGAPHPVETLALTRAVRQRETVIDARWRIRRPDGTEVLAIGSARPVYGEDGTHLGAVLTIHDDTQRHADQTALANAVHAKDMLLHEVNHRVKNSLQLVTSLLMLQAGKATSPELKQSLLEARGRIGVVAGMHQRLYTTEQHDRVDLSSYLGELAVDTIAALDGNGRIELAFDCPHPVELRLDRAVPLALVVSELLTNAVKYAFPDSDHGVVRVSIRLADGHIAIAVADDGRGLPHGFAPERSGGLGMRIVNALTRQLRGTLSVPPPDDGVGSCFLIVVPQDQ